MLQSRTNIFQTTDLDKYSKFKSNCPNGHDGGIFCCEDTIKKTWLEWVKRYHE